MKKINLYLVIICALLSVAGNVFAKELLVNGDFEIGTPQDDKASSFAARGWRRQLWREGEYNAWLTDGNRDRQLGKENQALQYRWGACNIYQVFSAVEENDYNFSADFHGSSKSCWQARIQVEWFNASDKPIGAIRTVAESDNSNLESAEWRKISGTAIAPAGTVYARVLLNANNRGEGGLWSGVYIDNASVTGEPGTHNLPVTFISTPYDLVLDAINESAPYKASLTDYAEDKDGDKLTFTRISGPEWLEIKSNGAMSGTPKFADAGDNKIVVKVEDGRGSSDQCTLTLPIIGFLRVGNLFDDDMVLQRSAPFTVYGVAVAGSPVSVEMSTGESGKATADADGKWSVKMPAMKISDDGSLAMTIVSGARKVVLKNLLVGDVWFCSGQSNMAWPLINTIGSKEEIASANIPGLRMVQTPETSGTEPWEDLDDRAEWNVSSPSVVEYFSAVGYYFGKELHQAVKVPIGLIVSAQGGTSIEVWAKELRPKGSNILYNSRVHPYTRMAIKGAIW